MGPFQSIRDFDVVNLCVEFLYTCRVRRGRRAEDVYFNNESFGGFSEVRYLVRDVILGDVVICGGVLDFAEQGLTRAAGGR